MTEPSSADRPDTDTAAADGRLEWRAPRLRKMPAVDAQVKAHHTPDNALPVQS